MAVAMVLYLILQQLLGENPRGAEFVPAVYHRDLLGESGQVQRFFHRRIASPDGDDLFSLEEWRIAGPAIADA
jgi:hypothetical protein